MDLSKKKRNDEPYDLLLCVDVFYMLSSMCKYLLCVDVFYM